MSQPKITNRREPNSRKKWFEISVTFINGKTREIAKFRSKGDVELYLLQWQRGNTATEIFID